MTSSSESPKVFISYTHDSPEHVDSVLALANRLRGEGIDAHIDQYETSPPEGWPRWTVKQIEAADYVLCVFTEIYQRRFRGEEEAGKGLGAQWEGAIITQELYEGAGNNKKFIPVVLSTEDSNHIPQILRGVQSYDLSSEEKYEELYRRLTNQPLVTKPELGRLVPLPTRERKQFFFNTWNTPHAPNPFFTGREDVLRQLQEALETKGVAAVSGMPGVGKTQTAVEYAHRHRSEYKLILWARAETRETLISDYVSIAGTLQLLEARAQEQNLAVGAVKRWFDANPDWLLILDNADDLSLAREFMPATPPKGHIILTTRAQATGAIATNVNVEQMEEAEGALFLLRRAKIIAEDATLETAAEEDKAKAIEISKEVDGLPLALDQAGAFIEESSSSPTEYLELYKTQGAALRRERGELVTGHPESVAITFSLSFEKVEAANPTAADLLRACAFLAPDSIPEEIFTEGGTHLGDLLSATVNNPLALLNAIKETLRYSLLRRDPNAHTLSIHRVVQDVLKDAMDESTQSQWAERIVKAVNQILPNFDETDYSEWHRFERLLPHTQACAGLVEIWDLKIPEVAQLLNNTARYMHNGGRLTEAESYYVQALTIRQGLFGDNHPEVATSLNNLGWLRHDQGKYEDAELFYLKALDVRVALLKFDDPRIAECLSSLGWVKSEQGKYVEAKGYFKRSIELQEQWEQNDTVLTAHNLHGLAWVLINQDYTIEVETLLLRSLEIKRKLYGLEHAEVAILIGDLGTYYSFNDNYVKAEEFLTNAIKMLEKIYGSSHPRIADYLNALAGVYIDQHNYSEAEALSIRAIAIARETYGKEHNRIGNMLGTLGLVYQAKREFLKAEELARQNLEIKEKSLGTEHPNTAITMTNLAVLYMDQREYMKAEQLLRRAIAVGRKTLPQGHSRLLERQEIYAVLLQRMNRKGESQKLADYVRKMRAKQERKKPKR